MKRFVQVYTGNGKGKTTASLGLTLRALGAGDSVFIGQFLKNGNYSEIKMLDKIQNILSEGQSLHVEQYGEPRFIKQTPRPEDVKAAAKGWQMIKEAVLSGNYQVVIAEEANVALKYNLISLDELLELIQSKPDNVELILTGRYAPPELIEAADLVSEIQEIKHYFNKSVPARKGIEF